MNTTLNLKDFQPEKQNIEAIIAESLAKIEKLNPQLNAATEILKTEAFNQIEKNIQGPLQGVPISVKECYAIAGKTIRSGSLRMTPIESKVDSIVVEKLKNAGAVIVARGNTSEFLLGRETDNLIYGTTKNAINQELTAGGSSGGDAALVASKCVAFGIGTDIGGSCRFPAAFNGIVGFKPASGQIDKTGIFPEAGNAFIESMNSPGILSRTVNDARVVYNVIGNKELDAKYVSKDVQIYSSLDFNIKIKDISISNALNYSLEKLNNIHNVKDISIPESGKLYTLSSILMCAGFTDKIYEWSTTENGDKLSFLGELIRRFKGKKTISDELFSMLLPFNLLKPSASKLDKTIETIKLLREKYYSLLGENGILILPTLGILAPQHKKFIPQYSKPGVIEIITPVSFCNILNLSSITIPAFKFQTDKKSSPPAIQLISAPGNEELLLNVADELELVLNT